MDRWIGFLEASQGRFRCEHYQVEDMVRVEGLIGFLEASQGSFRCEYYQVEEMVRVASLQWFRFPSLVFINSRFSDSELELLQEFGRGSIMDRSSRIPTSYMQKIIMRIIIRISEFKLYIYIIIVIVCI